MCSCFDVETRPATIFNFRIPKQDLVGQFVFLYRTPEQFERIKAAEATDEDEDEEEEGEEVEARAKETRLFVSEDEQSVLSTKDRSRSPTGSSDGSTIVVTPRQCSTEEALKASQTPNDAPDLSLERIAKTHAQWKSKWSTYEIETQEEENRFLRIDAMCQEQYIELEAQFGNQKTENERILQAKRDECVALEEKIAKQAQKMKEDDDHLDQRVRSLKRVSEALDDFDSERTKRAKLLGV